MAPVASSITMWMKEPTPFEWTFQMIAPLEVRVGGGGAIAGGRWGERVGLGRGGGGGDGGGGGAAQQALEEGGEAHGGVLLSALRGALGAGAVPAQVSEVVDAGGVAVAPLDA